MRAWLIGRASGRQVTVIRVICRSATPHSMLASVYVLVFFHRKMKLALLSHASHWKVALPRRFSGNVRTFEAPQVPQDFVHLVLHGS